MDHDWTTCHNETLLEGCDDPGWSDLLVGEGDCTSSTMKAVCSLLLNSTAVSEACQGAIEVVRDCILSECQVLCDEGPSFSEETVGDDGTILSRNVRNFIIGISVVAFLFCFDFTCEHRCCFRRYNKKKKRKSSSFCAQQEGKTDNEQSLDNPGKMQRKENENSTRSTEPPEPLSLAHLDMIPESQQVGSSPSETPMIFGDSSDETRQHANSRSAAPTPVINTASSSFDSSLLDVSSRSNHSLSSSTRSSRGIDRLRQHRDNIEDWYKTALVSPTRETSGRSSPSSSTTESKSVRFEASLQAGQPDLTD